MSYEDLKKKAELLGMHHADVIVSPPKTLEKFINKQEKKEKFNDNDNDKEQDAKENEDEEDYRIPNSIQDFIDELLSNFIEKEVLILEDAQVHNLLSNKNNIFTKLVEITSIIVKELGNIPMSKVEFFDEEDIQKLGYKSNAILNFNLVSANPLLQIFKLQKEVNQHLQCLIHNREKCLNLVLIDLPPKAIKYFDQKELKLTSLLKLQQQKQKYIKSIIDNNQFDYEVFKEAKAKIISIE